MSNVDATGPTPQGFDLLTQLKEGTKTPSLIKDNLSSIVCGNPTDSPSLSPFASTFIQEKIIRCFCCVRYVPFTRNCLTNEYVRHELGEDTQDTALKDLAQEYEAAKVALKEQCFNVDGIFDTDIVTHTNLKRKDTEDDQVNTLVALKGAFSASAIFTNIGTMCVTSSAIMKVQMIQLDAEAYKKEATNKKKLNAKNTTLEAAHVANEKKKKGEPLLVSDSKSIIMFMLPISGSA